MSDTTFLQLDRLTRTFKPGEPAVFNLELEVEEQEIVTLLGPSGCGKTTTLRMVAGFETPDSGRILLEGSDITSVAPQRRGFGMVFQHYALFPHLSVGGNIAFGLEGSKTPRPETELRVEKALELVRLPGIEDRSISSLSGGQQQRVALARALAPEPIVLLLDEPLSNLDATLRESTRRELRNLVKEIGITTIYVTHDQEEAFDLSDRIAVMHAGRLDQVGPAEQLYRRPATEFVATFLGRAGQIQGVIESIDSEAVRCVVAAGVTWTALRTPVGGLEVGARTRIFARPEAVRFSSSEEALRGEVVERRFAGSVFVYKVAVEGGELEVQTGGAGGEGGAGGREARVGDRVGLEPVAAPEGLFAFPDDPGSGE